MASRNAVVLGFAGVGLLAAGVAAWLLAGEGGPAPVPAEAPAPEEAAPAGKSAPGPSPAAAPAAPAPVAGDGSIRGRLVRGVARTPLAGSVKSVAEGIPPRTDATGPDGRFLLDEVPRGRPFTLRAEAPGVLPAEVLVRVPANGVLDIGDLVLGGPVLLEVGVRDVADRPLAGATVTLHRTRIFPQGGTDWIATQFESRDPPPPTFTRTTDGQGRASFEEAPPGSWFVRASAKGFADEGVSVTLAEGALREPTRIVLGPACALAGTVLGRDGKPVEGVLVRGFRVNSWFNSGLSDATFRTAADGKYRLDGLPRGPLSLAVEPTPGVRVTAGTVEIPSVATWDIRLGPVSGIQGKVVDDATGTGVPGVEVTVQTYPESGIGAQGTARTVAGEDGTFRFAGLPPGNIGALNVRAKGYLPYPGSETGAVMQPTRLPEGDVVEKEVRLRRGAALRGRVLDRAGKGIADAAVRFKTMNPRVGMEESPPVRTDAEGAFRIEGVARLKGLLKADARGYFQPDYPAQEWQALQQGPMPETCTVEVPAEGEGVKDLLLAPGGSVEGVVVDREGKAAPGVTVGVSSRTRGAGTGTSALTDAEGKFRVEGVMAAEDLVASASGPGSLRGTSEPFKLAEGESTPGIRITLKAAATVAGRVRREDGAAAQGATLRLVPGKKDPNQAWNWNWQRQNAPVRPVGADGAFRIEGIYPGPYTLACEADGAAVADGTVVDLAEGETKEGVEVLLPEEKRIAGKILDPEGAPVAGAAVRARPGGQQNRGFGGPDGDPASAVTDAAGLFAVRGLGKGTWRISVRAEGFGESAQTVEGGRDDLVFHLVAGLSIEGVVTDEGTGTPIPGISMWANPKVPAEGMNVARSAVSGKDGSFALRDLAPGAWVLNVSMGWNDPGGDYAQKTVDNVEAGTKDVRIALVKGLPIAGKVKDEAGRPATGLFVQAIGKDSNGNPDWTKQRGGQVQPDGSFRLGGLPAGNYDLTFNSNGMFGSSGGGAAPTTVKNVPAGTEDLVVTVKPGQPVSGKIMDEKGAPPGQPGNFQVTPSDDASGAGATWGNFQADGTFTTQPLEQGKSYDIVVHPVAGTMGGGLKGVTAGQKDLVVVLKRGGTITGRVLDDAGRAVPAGVQVTAIADDNARHSEPGASAHALTGAGGEFTLSGLGDMKFLITAGGGNSDYRPVRAEGVYAPGATGVAVQVRPGVAVEGRLSDSKGVWGRAQTWVMGTMEGEGGAGSSWQMVKEDGSFAIKGLAPGRVKLQVWKDNKQVDLGTFDAPSSGLSITVPD